MNVCCWKRSRNQQRAVVLLCKVWRRAEKSRGGERRALEEQPCRGYWRTTEITMKCTHKYCKCRKTEPVCFLHNRKLKAKCVKEKSKINECLHTNVWTSVCMYEYAYICKFIMTTATSLRLCQTADGSKAKSTNRQSDGLPACRPGPLLRASILYTTFCFIILHSAFHFYFITCAQRTTAAKHSHIIPYIYTYTYKSIEKCFYFTVQNSRFWQLSHSTHTCINTTTIVMMTVAKRN